MYKQLSGCVSKAILLRGTKQAFYNANTLRSQPSFAMNYVVTVE